MILSKFLPSLAPLGVTEPKNSEKSPKTTLGFYLEYCVAPGQGDSQIKRKKSFSKNSATRRIDRQEGEGKKLALFVNS